MIERAPVVIIGMGNRMRRDDGVGHVVVERLRAERVDTESCELELVILDGESTRLIEAWRDRARAIVVDAARVGDPPGSIHQLTVGSDVLPAWAAAASSHSAGLAEAIELARVLDVLPDELHIFGVEPADMAMGEGLSPPVAGVVPEVVDCLRTLLVDRQAAATA